MDTGLILKVAGVGLIVSVLYQVLSKTGRERNGNACFRDRNSYCAFNAGRGNCHSAEYDKITVWALDTELNDDGGMKNPKDTLQTSVRRLIYKKIISNDVSLKVLCSTGWRD